MSDFFVESKLPSGWSWRQLAEITEIDQVSLSGSTDPKFQFNYIDISSVSTGNISEQLETYQFAESPSRARRVVREFDILMSTVRPNLKSFAMFKASSFPTVASTGFAIISPSNDYDQQYIYACLLSEVVSQQIQRVAVGSNYPAINSSDVKKLWVPFPTLPIRKKIGSILKTIDNQIDATHALINKYTAIKQGMMADLFSRGIDPETKALRPTFEEVPELYHETSLGKLPKGWDVLDIEDVADVIDPNPSHRNPIYRSDGFAFISTVEFVEGDSVETNTSRRVAESVVLEQERRCTFTENSIVFSRKGTIGETRFVPNSCRFALLDSLCVINPKNINVSYFYYSLRSLALETQINQMVMGQALPQVSIGRVRELLIPMPVDALEQKLIGQRIKKIAELLNTELLHLRKLQAQKAGLMQDLLTGKVPVPA
ncbi:restriction endonuclease subunit S [Colwelliaceae bacterium 6471]